MLTARRRAGLFISARNEHVKRQIRQHYESQGYLRSINVYCVGNVLYSKAVERQQRARNVQSLSHKEDLTSAADQMFRSSGIPDLQHFIQGIPSNSQVAETRHFLNTRLVTLLEKIELWLNASVPGMAASQLATQAFVEEIQTELKTVGAKSDSRLA